MRRIMIAGTHSGCGKTTVTCAVLAALKNRGINIAAFKCGPDYIDPMFHKTVIGVPSRNLDSVLMTDYTVKYLLDKNSSDVNIIEGVMGFYDGLGFSVKGSSYDISEITDTPVILVEDCKGKSLSVIAEIKGFKEFCDNKICGVIFNNSTERLYERLSDECVKMGIVPFGFMPYMSDAKIESRHLGLVTSQEIGDIKDKLERLSKQAEDTIDIDRILAAAERRDTKINPEHADKIADVKIAVARDNAFCFYYDDNLDLLREMGAKIIEFSPLNNEPVPDCDGIILGGGYPELYADILEKNTATLRSVKEKIKGGVPTIAECGGFMYLHKSLTAKDGETYKMSGVIDGNCFWTGKLKRFGYMEMTARSDNILCKRGHKIMSREFHYFDSESCGDGFCAVKNENKWDCIHTQGNLFAGFPHIHFYSDKTLAENFIKRCEKYRCTK